MSRKEAVSSILKEYYKDVKHGCADCSDDNPINGYYKGFDTYYRCPRCALIQKLHKNLQISNKYS